MGRIGVLGGTFDPPHIGHTAVALAAHRQLELDRVLWVPAGQPPHKPSQTIARHRLRMTELAISGRPLFSICRLDLDRPGPHYTVELLDLLRTEHGPAAQLWFLIGEDSLRELLSWYAPDRILDRCRLAVFPRPGAPINWRSLEQAIPGIRDKIDRLEAPPVELASTAIREKVRLGQSIHGLVAPAVERYIEQQQLYAPQAITLPTSAGLDAST